MKKRGISFFLVVLMIFLCCIPNIESHAYTAHTKDEAIAWVKSLEGQAYDYDKSYGAQCVDLIFGYYNYLGVKVVFGNGKDFVNNSLPSGWTRVYSGFQPGDVLATTKSYGGYDTGHVGILTAVNGSNFEVYDINGSKTGIVAKSSYSNNGYWECAIRPDFTPPVVKGKRMETGSGWKIPDGDYRIVCGLSSADCYEQDSWAALDIAGLDTPCANGTNVQLCKNMTHPNDVFTVTALDNGFYKITQKGTDMALEVKGASMYQEANVQMGTYDSNNEAQMWDIKADSDISGRGTGWYALRARNNSFALDIVGGDNAAPDDGRNAQVYTWNSTKNQKWKFIPVSTDEVDEGDYHILYDKDKSFGLGVSKGSSANPDYPNAVLSDDIIGKDKVYTIKKQGSFYCIQQKSTGNYLDVEGAGSLTNVGFWPREIEDKVAASHIWSFKSDGAGAYYIVSMFNGAYLDLVDGVIQSGQNVRIWKCYLAEAQRWNLVKVVQGLSLDQEEIELEVGGTETLNPVFTPSDAGIKHVMWDSSDPAVATVDQNGKVTAVALGTTEITATSIDGGFSAKCTVTVSKKVVTKKFTVKFDANGKTAKNMPKSQTVEKGKTASKPATDPKADGYVFSGWYAEAACENAFDFSAPINADTTVYAKWLDENTDIFTVTFDLNGRPGKAPATQKVEKDQTASRPTADPTAFGYRFTDWYNEAECTTKYDFAAPVTANITIYAGWEKIDMPDNGLSALDNKPVIDEDTSAIYLVKGQKFIIGADWISADKNAFSINKKGVAMAKKVTAAPVKIKKGSKEIEVNIIKPEITKSMTIEAETSKPITLIYDTDNMPVFWYSANPDVATVDQEGNVTAVAKGSAKVTAYINGSAYNCTVKVTEKNVVPKERTLHVVVGQSKTVKLSGLKNYEWKSGDDTIVSVKKNKFTAKAVGNTEVTATVGEDTYTVTVYVEDLTVNGAEAAKGKNKYTLDLNVGVSGEPVAMLSFDDSLAQPVVFKSNKPDVAFVDEDGYVYTRNTGKAKFTAKVDGKTITITVKVE